MPVTTAPEPGSFCWIELGAADIASAKRFYQSLAGWQAADSPGGPSGTYTVFLVAGTPAAGGYELTPAMRAAGVPPHWLPFIACDDADTAARRVGELGGGVMRPPFDAGDLGRMAVVHDPTGAVFAVWQAKRTMGFARDLPNSFCWADLSTPDPAKAQAFYEALFGWKLWAAPKDSSGYLHISLNDRPIGGVPPLSARNPKAPPHWLIWLAVEDCDAAAARVEAAGGRIWVKPQSMPGVGRFAVAADPQGAPFGIIKAEPR